MRFLLSAVGLLLSLAVMALAGAMALRSAWTGALLLLALAVVLLPGVRRLTGFPLPGWLRGGLFVAIAAGLFFWAAGADRTSIFDSPAVQAEFERLYAEKLSQWPVPYEERLLETRHGRVHVIVAGPADAPPVLLLHAGGAASWIWGGNVEQLSRTFRIFAVDRLGDPGLSRYTTLGERIGSARERAAHLVEVMDLLGIDAAHVVGASQGGYEAFLLAGFHPDRVRRMVLIAPLGLSGTSQAALRLGLAYLFPLRPVIEATFLRVFSEDREVRTAFAEWFPLTVSGTLPVNPVVRPLSEVDRDAMVRPTLFVLGSSDRVLGDPDAVRLQLSDMPNAEVAVVEGGHLVAGERPEDVTRLIVAFLSGG